VAAVTAGEASPDRLAKIREAAGDMDEALREEGFDHQGSHAVFVRWQRASVEALGAIVVEAEMILATARREGEADRRRIERMIEAGANALAMAHRAVENAGVASAHAQQMVDEGVAGIFARVSKALVEGTPRWFSFEQTARHRLYACKVAAWASAGAVLAFIGGIATTHWWDAKESAARQAMLEALDRCWVQPVMVRTADGKTVEMCRLADLTKDRPN
jgi:ribosomal protein L17